MVYYHALNFSLKLFDLFILFFIFYYFYFFIFLFFNEVPKFFKYSILEHLLDKWSLLGVKTYFQNRQTKVVVQIMFRLLGCICKPLIKRRFSLMDLLLKVFVLIMTVSE